MIDIFCYCWAVDVERLVERLLSTPKIHSSNPLIWNLYLQLTVSNRHKKNSKEPVNGPFLKRSCVIRITKVELIEVVRNVLCLICSWICLADIVSKITYFCFFKWYLVDAAVIGRPSSLILTQTKEAQLVERSFLTPNVHGSNTGIVNFILCQLYLKDKKGQTMAIFSKICSIVATIAGHLKLFSAQLQQFLDIYVDFLPHRRNVLLNCRHFKHVRHFLLNCRHFLLDWRHFRHFLLYFWLFLLNGTHCKALIGTYEHFLRNRNIRV